ncbi:hypothetical protein [Paenibacillus illinoisensis]|uniref:Uncharacterized protein n=1 Tax=Paenibacillus illinoisensis TaxID=59845 RepID=A0A2W0CC39_9BACL|nr:hypothetical protein [Paenibacillus illinoisensis]PYY29737.1 Uncharacterized protein PIL02S_01937 [Paenibacillus illinoisensis]
MSKNYWDIFSNFTRDDSSLVHVLKFHQKTVQTLNYVNPKTHKLETVYKYDSKKNHSRFSDTIIKQIALKELNVQFQDLFNSLKEAIHSQREIVTLPILSIFRNNCNLNVGHYSFNFNDDFLIQYKDRNVVCPNNNIMFSLTYFLDIEKSIYLFGGERGYLEGILQIGTITECMRQSFSHCKLTRESQYIPDQLFAHNAGINIRKQLMVCTDYYIN